MYRLYWRYDSGSFAPDALLELSGPRFERIHVDSRKGETQHPDYLALNPLAQIPTLILPDGTVLTETAAMVLHLTETFPSAGLAPERDSVERPPFLRWLLFLATNMYPAELRDTYPERWTADPAGAPAVRDRARADKARLWRIYAAALGERDWMVGSRMSALDIYAAMLAGWWADRVTEPAIAALVDRVRANPVCGRLWDEYGFGAG